MSGSDGAADGVVVVVVAGAAVVATLDAIEVAIEASVAFVATMRVVPDEFGPARTASDTGWPLCSAADTCDSSAFCCGSVTFHAPEARADARLGETVPPAPVALNVATLVPPTFCPACPAVTT